MKLWKICAFVVFGLFASAVYMDYDSNKLRRQVAELLSAKVEEALASQGEIQYDYNKGGRSLSALFISGASQLYPGAPCRVYTGRMEKERVTPKHVVVKYTPKAPVSWECPSALIALAKENWIFAYTTHSVVSGEYARQMEAKKANAIAKERQDRIAARQKERQEVERKALELLKQEGILDDK